MIRLRVLLHCVTRVGIGHFVRTREIARAVAEHHDAFLVDDAAPVPDRPIHATIKRVRIPSVIRDGGHVRPGQPGTTLGETLASRRDLLIGAARSIRPDILTVEHFPFSKLEHRDEILPLIEAARASNRNVRVICSIRDLAPKPNYRPAGEDYRQEVLDTLHGWFDALMVHTDPRFVELSDSLDWANSIRLPLAYTGFVAEQLTRPPADGADRKRRAGTTGPIIVSGGGRRDAGLYDSCVNAWIELNRRGHTGGRNMVLIAPAGIDPDEIVDPRLLHGSETITVEPFSPALIDRLNYSDLSISQGGYNTCTNILLSGARAILVPNRNSADQVQRARLLAERGLCAVLDEEKLDAVDLADVIERQLASKPRGHDLDLEGARRSVEVMEGWATSRPTSTGCQ
ncbi:MAG: glycosyltransferase [Pseudomonadota bacterium]